ncbi:MAG TPA: TonB-dependent receptor [Cytophagaceae bacterium]|jgi:hypothetical protein
MSSLSIKNIGFCLLCSFFFSLVGFSQDKRFTISGYLREKGSRESIPGALVSVPTLNTGTSTNAYGFYSITLPEVDSITLVFTMTGYKVTPYKTALRSNINFDLDLEPETEEMEQVVIEGERPQEKLSENVQMSAIDIPIQQIKSIPAFLGEKDVMKVIQLMPGVQKGSEGSSGIYVRGGGPDQNLIILDDAVVYNANHLFGFFSLFNGSALKSVELYKGGFPARYGGRLSSVIEMNMKDGNKEKLSGEVGIGLIASRFTMEGPLKKGKSSFLVSGRRTYIDLLIMPFLPKDSKGGYYFYDLNAKLHFDLNRKNKLYLSGYFGRDKFYLKYKDDQNSSEAAIFWGNATTTARLNHLWTDRLFSNSSLIFSNFRFTVSVKDNYEDQQFSAQYNSGIRDFTFKHDFDFLPNPNHKIKFGLALTHHTFTPGASVVKSNDISERTGSQIYSFEGGAYGEDVIKVNQRLTIAPGIRISQFLVRGKNYLNVEPRFSSTYKIADNLAAKASYAQMNQYLHMLSNTSIGLPTDLWVPATDRIKPQRSQQVAAGLVRDFPQKNFSVSLEGYYKKSDNIIGYKPGASFVVFEDNDNREFEYERTVTSGQGWSYGMEFLIQKKYGKFSGWIGYTLSWTQLQFDSINNGRKFYARYDRRHDISVVGIYKISEKVTLSATWVYGTGNAITLPIGTYHTNTSRELVPRNNSFGNQLFPGTTEYSEWNAFRMSAYHRLDLGIQLHKTLKWGGERTWEFSLYNAYSRQNPFYYFIDYGRYRNSLSQVALFPLLPSLSYTLKF